MEGRVGLRSRESGAQTKTAGHPISAHCKERTLHAEAAQRLECCFSKHGESPSIGGALTLSMYLWWKCGWRKQALETGNQMFIECLLLASSWASSLHKIRQIHGLYSELIIILEEGWTKNSLNFLLVLRVYDTMSLICSIMHSMTHKWENVSNVTL